MMHGLLIIALRFSRWGQRTGASTRRKKEKEKRKKKNFKIRVRKVHAVKSVIWIKYKTIV